MQTNMANGGPPPAPPLPPMAPAPPLNLDLPKKENRPSEAKKPSQRPPLKKKEDLLDSIKNFNVVSLRKVSTNTDPKSKSKPAPLPNTNPKGLVVADQLKLALENHRKFISVETDSSGIEDWDDNS
jgi:hypothetical protein